MVRFLVRRPIGTTMVFIAIAALGLLASRQMPISLMPDIEIPEITIQVSFDNFTSEQIEHSILQPLREELLQTQYLDEIKSEARNGQGIISMRFDYGTDISHTAIEVNEKVDAATNRLPEGISRPRVIKASAVDIPVFTINVGLKNGNENEQKLLELSEFAEMVLKRRIEQLAEVALVDMSGLVHPEIKVQLDSSRVVQLGVDFDMIEDAIKENNQEFGNILIREGHYQYNVKIGNRLISVKDLNSILVNSKDRIFMLGELAHIELVTKKSTGLYDANGHRSIAMAVIKQSDSKLEDMASSVKQALLHLEKDYPDLTFEITRDQSQLLLVTIDSLKQSLLIGGSLAFLVMFFFLRDIRSPLLIGISIPVSLVVSVLGFYWMDISVNIVSLSGLMLGVGMMIDNSIIVIDNISQWMERGAPLTQACIKGAGEVFRPMLSSVLTTCAVFLPLVYLSGIAGALFYDQAVAVTVGLFASLGVAVTLIPVYFRLLYKNRRIAGWNKKLQFKSTISFKGLYKTGLDSILQHQKLMIALLVIILFSIYPLYLLLKKERFPEITETAMLINIDWNENIHVDENRRRVLEVISPLSGQILQHNTEVGQQQYILSGNASSKSPNESLVYILAKDPKDIPKMKETISGSMAFRYPNASVAYTRPENAFERLFDTDESPFVARVILDDSRVRANPLETLDPLQKALEASFPSFQPLPLERVITISLNHENILLYGVEIPTVINEIRTLLNEQVIGELKSFQRFTEIKAGSHSKDLLYQLEHHWLMSKEGNKVPVKSLLTTSFEERLKTINAGKDGSYYPFHFRITDAEVDKYMDQITEMVSAHGATVQFSGGLMRNLELVRELGVVLLVALTLLYFILAAQFESLWQPLIILMEVPMNFTACFLGLYLTGNTLNVMSLIGLIVMSGVIVNDSILKVDTINQLRKGGLSTNEAITEGGERRLKPILMTSITTILALVPFLFYADLGSELQRPLAITVICGMLSGTFVSLYYVPLFYRWIVKW